MPVLIAALSDDLGLVVPLARRLREDGGEVRCYLPDDAWELRAIGCKLAVGHPLDEMNLEASLTNVHTFVPVLPDPAAVEDPDSLDLLVAYGRTAAGAAGDSSIEQTILCIPALAPEHPAAGAYEAIASEFAGTCDPVCVLRTGLVWRRDGPLAAGMRALAVEDLPAGTGTATLSAVSLADVVALVAEVDDREGTHGEWDLGGAAVPLDVLRALDWGDGPPAAFGPWMREALFAGRVTGNSAVEAFGVALSPVA